MPVVNYENQVFCAVPDQMGANAICRWEERHVRWHWTRGTYTSGLSNDALYAMFQRAIGTWCKPRSGLTNEYVSNSKTANLLISFDRKPPLGTKLNVLAWCELPCGPTTRQLRMMIDDVESWVIAQNPPSDKVDIERVVKHEWGHGIGIEHLSDGNLMGPRYSSQIPDLMQGDIVAMLARYPLPPSEPPPPPPPPPADTWKELAAVGTRGQKIVLRAFGVEFPVNLTAEQVAQIDQLGLIQHLQG